MASLTIQTLRLPLPTLSRMFATSADSLFTSSCVGLKQDIHAQTKIVMAMDTALCMDTAGLCSVIGSLASVINYRLYVRSYPGQGGRFMKVFTLISWAFFLIVVIPGYFLSKYWLI